MPVCFFDQRERSVTEFLHYSIRGDRSTRVHRLNPCRGEGVPQSVEGDGLRNLGGIKRITKTGPHVGEPAAFLGREQKPVERRLDANVLAQDLFQLGP